MAARRTTTATAALVASTDVVARATMVPKAAPLTLASPTASSASCTAGAAAANTRCRTAAEISYCADQFIPFQARHCDDFHLRRHLVAQYPIAPQRREFDRRTSIALVLPRAADIAINAFTVAARAVPG